MTLIFFVAAVVIAAVLEWQRRRHKLEMEALCERLGVVMVPARTRVRMPEAILTAYLGLLGLVFGGLAAWASLESSGILRAEPADGSQLLEGSYQLMVVLVGGGAALLVLGLRACYSSLILAGGRRSPREK